MNTSRFALAALAGLLLSATPQDASAQLRRYSNQINRIINSAQGHHDSHSSHKNHYNPGYHIDHHDHVIRDSHGHVIGNYHHDVVHRNSTYIVPHTSHANHHGTYHLHNGNFYYTARTASNSRTAQRAVAVNFGSFSHVEDLASRLEELTNEFCLVLHYNYSHNHGFRETYAEGYQLMLVAKFIHDAEHANDRDAIRSKLNGMDELFHHVQDDVRGWSRHHRRQIGQLGILSKMDMIESTLHHLMNDVGVHATGGEQAPPPGGLREQAPAPLTVAPPPSLP
ncbi:MAG TPA: hypothetical protein EYG03_04155 [Planctomycetes bacterium]|nr:hypothetical protein [Planctomycetota bacterium]